MKSLEGAFASRTVRRVVLPGIILTIGLHPAVGGLLAASGDVYGIEDSGLILVIEIFFWGLLISSAINPIYYVYEGFRLPWLTALARSANEKLVRRNEQALKSLLASKTYDELSSSEQDRVSLLYEELQDFPLKRDAATNEVRHFVDRPTRLGNIIATYELYPESRYNVDGVFFWHHFLTFAPASVVSEFDEQYGFAESLVLTSFAGLLAALANIAVLVGLAIGTASPALILVPLSVTISQCLALILLGLVVSVLFYRLSLPAHRESGKIFRTAVDLAIPQFTEWVQKVAPASTDLKHKIAAVHAYLDGLEPPPQPADAGPKMESVGPIRVVVAAVREFIRYCRKGNG